ncbi:MAG: hypothetical protein A2Z04_00320 [Chloroflexi bacterium RBG_16_57_9]|nr:MAG: hypothetical protein A2Z04_00320 [Chloroflexi bacterium RBG_16_57_9]
MKDYTQQARLFKALAHPVRLQILSLLRQEPECVCHLTAVLGLRQAYVSQHLAALRAAGLVIDQKDGLNVYYQVRDSQVFDVIDRVQTLGAWSRSGTHGTEQPRPALRVVQDGCPCPKCQAA